MTSALHKVSIAMIKHCHEEQLGGGKFFFHLSSCKLFTEGTWEKIQSRTLKRAAWSRSHGGAFHTDFAPMTYSVCFLRQPRITHLEVAVSVISWALLHYHQSWKCNTDLPTGQSDWDIFSIEDLFSQSTAAYVAEIYLARRPY